MARAETLPLFARRGLWFVFVGAALTGFWLAPVTLIDAIGQRDVQHWTYAVCGLLLLVAGIAGWIWLVSAEPRREIGRVIQTAGVTILAFLPTLWIVVAIGFKYSTCGPGEANGPATIAWLAPVIVYYSLGYLGFARSRWLHLIWPLAAVAAVLVLLAIEVIWTTGFGCPSD